MMRYQKNGTTQKVRSFSRRVTVSLSLIITFVSLTILAFVYLYTLHTGERDLDLKADEYLHYLTEALAMPLWNIDKKGASLIANSVLQNDLVVQMKVEDELDQVIVDMQRESTGLAITRSADIFFQDEIVGKISFDLSMRSSQEKARELLVIFGLIVTLILLILLIFTGYFVRTFLLGPLEILDRIADKYSEGIYKVSMNQSVYLEFQPIFGVLSKMGDEIGRQLEIVKAAEQKYRSIYENSIEGIFQCTPEGLYLSVNPAFAQLHGYSSPEELVSHLTDTDDQSYVDPEDWQKYRRTLENQGNIQGFEIEKYRRDGSKIWVSINARVVRNSSINSSTTPIYFEGSLVDITDRKQAQLELEKHREYLEELVDERTAALSEAKQQAEVAKERAEKANSAKSNFLASMSHELRTPLNAILGYAQIYLRRNPERDLAKGLTTIQQSGEHLLTLINDILDTARIETGKVELSPELVQLDTFLETLMAIVGTTAEAKGLEVTLEKPTTMPTVVMADAVRLRQVLLNLLNNAIKFTDIGRVTLRLSHQDNDQQDNFVQLQFAVTDTGIGISADLIERIFLPFEQASNDLQRRSVGSGLGLFISRQLVSLMGGELAVDSKPGRGTTFSFTVVVPKAEAQKDKEITCTREITGYNGPRCKVLIVDDITSNRLVLTGMLQMIGFEMVEAANGRQAVEIAQKNPPDLILMDQYMPVMDGLSAIKKMRKIPELMKVPALAISASVAEEDRRELLVSGFDGFVSKPVHWARLSELLQTHLDLEWQYPEEIEAQEEVIVDTRPLIPPPIEHLSLLQEIALIGDMEGIINQADQIELLDEKYTPFARSLRELAESFEDQQILAMVEQCME